MSIYDLSIFDMRPKADDRFVIKWDKYRITVLTEQMLRLEYSANVVFEDRGIGNETRGCILSFAKGHGYF